MAIGTPNAVINSTRTNPATNVTTAILSNQNAGIGVPGPKDQAQYGGTVTYMMILDPGTDIRAGDKVFIQRWGKHIIDPTHGYNVRQADPSGFRELEVIRVPISSTGNR